jgi:ribosome biogenesis protein SSF1/2
MLDLGNEKDVADFLLRKTGELGPDGGYESAASSTESVAGDDGDAVDLAEDYVGRNNRKGQRRAIRLDEVGPRMELRLIKITEGVPGKEGAVMYHEFGMILFSLLIMDYCLITRWTVKKSKKEALAQKAEHAARTKLKKERREEQERNVQRKLTKEKIEEEKEEMHDDGWDGIGRWDDDEEISDGEDSDDPVESGSDEESSEEQRPTKRVKLREKS